MGFLINKTLYYEFKYLYRIFPLHRLLLLFFTLVGATVISFSDAQAFFTADNSPLPQDWTILKNPQNAKIAAVFIIIFPSIFILLSQGYEESKEVEELLKITQDFSLPFLQKDLNDFHKGLVRQFNLSGDCRMYILQPTRKRLAKWYLHIICHTENVENRELGLKLELDEGAIGYAFQLINKTSRYGIQYISLEKADDIPAGYKHLSQNNKNITKANIKGYLVVPSFQGNFLNTLFIIDTTDSNDLVKFKDENLHKKIFEWIGDDPKFLTLLWRLKNNGG